MNSAVQLGLWDAPASPPIEPPRPPRYKVGDVVNGRIVLAVWWNDTGYAGSSAWQYRVAYPQWPEHPYLTGDESIEAAAARDRARAEAFKRSPWHPANWSKPE